MDRETRDHWAPKAIELVTDTTPVFQALKNAERRIIVNIGGAGSSKTHSTAQYIIERFLFCQDQHIMVARKHLPSLRDTSMKVIIDLLQSGYRNKKTGRPVDLYKHCEHNKTHNNLKFNRNLIEFRGLDDPEKGKSNQYNLIWWEEANEFTWMDYTKIITRGLRRPTTDKVPNRAILTLNPEDSLCWIKTKLEDTNDAEVIHSTYHDNPTLSAEYIEELEKLKHTDPDYYSIFARGEYAATRDQVYRPFIEHQDFEDIEYDDVCYGVDFGWSCTAVYMLGFKYEEGKPLPDMYLTQVIHQGIDIKKNTKPLTNTELIEKLKKTVPPEHISGIPWYCDHAEPARIEEMRQAGFWVKKADKDRITGIDFCKRLTIHTLCDNIFINTERALYKYVKDYNGNVISDDPKKKNDHGLDAMRYGAYTHISPVVNWRPGVFVEDSEKKDSINREHQEQRRHALLDMGCQEALTEEERDALVERDEIWESLAL